MKKLLYKEKFEIKTNNSSSRTVKYDLGIKECLVMRRTKYLAEFYDCFHILFLNKPCVFDGMFSYTFELIFIFYNI